jgi:hypothetical protein
MNAPGVTEEGLRAWTDGDLDALEAVLDPQVNLLWAEPGPWDCPDGPQPFPVATRVTVADGRVIAMQQ